MPQQSIDKNVFPEVQGTAQSVLLPYIGFFLKYWYVAGPMDCILTSNSVNWFL